MLRTSLSIVLAALIAACLPGCESTPVVDDTPITTTTLPNREVQASIIGDVGDVYNASLRTLEELGYTIDSHRFNPKTKSGVIAGTIEGGGSARVEVRPKRDFQSTLVQVLAVEPGAKEASPELGDDVLQQIKRAMGAPTK